MAERIQDPAGGDLVINRADAFIFVMSVDKEIAESLGEKPLAADLLYSGQSSKSVTKRTLLAHLPRAKQRAAASAFWRKVPESPGARRGQSGAVGDSEQVREVYRPTASESEYSGLPDIDAITSIGILAAAVQDSTVDQRDETAST